ncbi:uncharacterized protein LOC121370594 isoform X2 [Gigantopelta aegis]|uniref:uncharacterized protein LOC121370594 isoform X2 n=1 Tax=Gigantopelta aegis TaxID=1735272 RepID=UPI001B88A172|nr:uncharacterized protein LOC121370594 isoform X2 [Gigantopelta aegis]
MIVRSHPNTVRDVKDSERRNKQEDVRLEQTLRTFDKQRVRFCYNIDLEKKHVRSDIENIQRSTGNSEKGKRPKDRGDAAYQESVHYNTANRLSEKRLSMWRECEKHLALFLTRHFENDSTSTRRSSRPVSVPTKIPLFERVPIEQLNRRSSGKIRPHTAAAADRKNSDSKKVECPARPKSSCPTMVGTDRRKSSTAKSSVSRSSMSSIAKYSESSGVHFANRKTDATNDTLLASRSVTDSDEDLIRFWQEKKKQSARESQRIESLKFNNYVGVQHTRDKRDSASNKSKGVSHHVEFEHSQAGTHSTPESTLSATTIVSNIESATAPQLKLFTSKRNKPVETIIKQSLIYSKTARKHMLEQMVDRTCPDQREMIRQERLRLSKLDQLILTEATHEFCRMLDGYNKYDSSESSVQCQ